MSKYSPELYQAFHAVKKPADVKIEVAEVDQGLILYCNEAQLNQLEEFEPKKFEWFCEYIFTLIQIAERHGVQCIPLKKPMI